MKPCSRTGTTILAPTPAAATMDALDMVAKRPLFFVSRVDRETIELCAV